MSGPYKMKGSPMYRNYGIESPVKLKELVTESTDAKPRKKLQAKTQKKTKSMTEIDKKDLGKYQKPAEGFKWVMLDGKPSQVNI